MKLRLLACGVALLGTGLSAQTATAQGYPSRPVRVTVGYPAGTSPDLNARVANMELGRRLGQQFIVENRPGANGALAPATTMKSDPDGYTLYFGGMTNLHPIFIKNGALVAGKDLAPIGDLVSTSWVLFARGSLNAKSLQDLVAYSKANPGKVNFGSVSSTIDLFMEMVKNRTGLSYTPIRYKGAPVNELISGEIDFYMGTLSGLMPHLQSGKIVAVLATTKIESLPNVPSATDVGLPPQFEIRSRSGFWGPPGIAHDTVQKLSSALAAAATVPEAADQFHKLGFDVSYTTPEGQLKDYLSQIDFYTEATKLAHYEPQ